MKLSQLNAQLPLASVRERTEGAANRGYSSIAAAIRVCILLSANFQTSTTIGSYHTQLGRREPEKKIGAPENARVE